MNKNIVSTIIGLTLAVTACRATQNPQIEAFGNEPNPPQLHPIDTIPTPGSESKPSSDGTVSKEFSQPYPKLSQPIPYIVFPQKDLLIFQDEPLEMMINNNDEKLQNIFYGTIPHIYLTNQARIYSGPPIQTMVDSKYGMKIDQGDLLLEVEVNDMEYLTKQLILAKIVHIDDRDLIMIYGVIEDSITSLLTAHG